MSDTTRDPRIMKLLFALTLLFFIALYGASMFSLGYLYHAEVIHHAK